MKRVLSLLLLTAVSCTSRNTPVDGVKQLLPLSQTSEITLESLPSIIKSERLIKIQPAEGVSLSRANGMEIAPNGDLIIRDRATIYQYSPEGEFIRKIGAKGRAANEYIDFAAVAIDPWSNTLMVLDASSRVVRYDLATGAHVESIRFDVNGEKFYPNLIIPTAEGGFMVVRGVPVAHERGEATPVLSEFTASGEWITDHITIDGVGLMSGMCSVRRGDDGSYLLNPFDVRHVVHRIEGSEVTPAYQFDFEGRGERDGDILNAAGVEDIMGYISSPRYKNPVSVQEGGEYLFFQVMGPNSSAISYLFNTESLEGYSFAAPNGRTVPISPVAADSLYLYYIYSKYSDEGMETYADPLTRYMIEKYGVIAPEDDLYIIGVEYGF